MITVGYVPFVWHLQTFLPFNVKFLQLIPCNQINAEDSHCIIPVQIMNLFHKSQRFMSILQSLHNRFADTFRIWISQSQMLKLQTRAQKTNKKLHHKTKPLELVLF